MPRSASAPNNWVAVTGLKSKSTCEMLRSVRANLTLESLMLSARATVLRCMDAEGCRDDSEDWRCWPVALPVDGEGVLPAFAPSRAAATLPLVL